MKGYFYSAADAETLHAAYPSGFQLDDESGEVEPVSPLTLRSQNGVWLTSPVMSEPDPETGEQTIVTPGVRSDNCVVVSSLPIGVLSAYLIEPEGETLA